MCREVVVLGSTGAVGAQALDVIRANRDRFRVSGLAAGGDNIDLLAKQMHEFQCDVAGVAKEGVAHVIRDAFLARAARRRRFITPRTRSVSRHFSAADCVFRRSSKPLPRYCLSGTAARPSGLSKTCSTRIDGHGFAPHSEYPAWANGR